VWCGCAAEQFLITAREVTEVAALQRGAPRATTAAAPLAGAPDRLLQTLVEIEQAETIARCTKHWCA
jgi:hypothetical protein